MDKSIPTCTMGTKRTKKKGYADQTILWKKIKIEKYIRKKKDMQIKQY